MSASYLDELISQMNMRNKYAYIIRLVSDHSWYFFDMETDVFPHPVMWTPNIKQAFWFNDEQAVEEFRSDFITPREVEILRIARDKVRR